MAKGRKGWDERKRGGGVCTESKAKVDVSVGQGGRWCRRGLGDDGSGGGSKARQRSCCVGDRSVAGAQRAAVGCRAVGGEGVGRGSEGKRAGEAVAATA